MKFALVGVIFQMEHKKARCILIFFLDAFRHDDITPEYTPYLFDLAEKGISGPMETILGFTGIGATIFAGTYPCDHGVWTQYKLSSNSSPFDWIEPFSVSLEKVDTILRRDSFRVLRKGLGLAILQLSRFRCGMTYYPGVHRIPYSLLPKLDFSTRKRFYDKNALGGIPTLFDIFREKGIKFSIVDYSLMGSDATVLQKALRIKEVPEVLLIRFMDLDPVSHYHGLQSIARSKKLKETDNAIRAIIEHFKKRDCDPFSVIFADHGMVEVTKTCNVIHALKGIAPESKRYMKFLDSTMARFWGDEETIGEISRRLAATGSGQILSTEDLKHYKAPLDPSYGDLIYLANPGTIFVPNYYEDSPGVKAMHGYDPSISDQHTIFILAHNGLTAKKLKKVKLVDILPTILEILNIPQPRKYEGKSVLH
jgi:predicted AlkP superfamily pyrophosphatase or phosphodiesterase